jgi:hypothetical protein
MDHHPFSAKPFTGIHMTHQISIDTIADMRRDLCYIHGRHRMNANVNFMRVAKSPDICHSFVGKTFNGIRRNVDFQVEETHAMIDRGMNPILNPVALAKINPNPVAEGHYQNPFSEISSYSQNVPAVFTLLAQSSGVQFKFIKPTWPDDFGNIPIGATEF